MAHALADYVAAANANLDCCKYVSSQSWLHLGPATAPHDFAAQARARACGRILQLLGPQLGALPRTVGDCHLSSHVRARRGEALQARARGGPAAHVCSTSALSAARYRGGPHSSSRAGLGAPSFPKALRWDADARSAALAAVAAAQGAQDPLAPCASAPSPAAAVAAALAGRGKGSPTDPLPPSPLLGLGRPGLEWECKEGEEEAPEGLPAAARPAALVLEVEEEGAWEGVELAESKEAEAEPLRAPPPALAQAPASCSAAPCALAQRLRRLGVQRALERSVLGEALTPAAFVFPALATAGGPPPAVDATRAVREWALGPATIAPGKGACLTPRQRHVLAAQAYKQRCIRQGRGASASASAGSAGCAGGLAALDPAPHKVLPLGPLALPSGRSHSACPALQRARERREMRERAQRSRQGGGAIGTPGAGGGVVRGRQAVGPSVEAERARNWRLAGEERGRKRRVEAAGGAPKSALQLWREGSMK